MTKPLTKEQRIALFRIYNREWNAKPETYLAFRRTAYNSHMGCVMVPWANMWLGIEPDGYTHS
jgi:hypothetical protein